MSQEVWNKILEDRLKESSANLKVAERAYKQAKIEYQKAMNEYSQWRNPK